MNEVLHLNNKDNVVTCLRPMLKGEKVTIGSIQATAVSDIPEYHKIAISDIPVGGYCYKYGEIIGTAIQNISIGEHVHVHNIESTRGRGDKKGK